jgi:anti-sigma B factor antagonist
MKSRGEPGAWLRKVSTGGEEVVLELGGDVDISSVGPLQEQITEAIAGKPPKVIFHLRELRFMDSSGIALLVATAQLVDQVELRYPPPTVRRVIELTGLSATLPITS